VLTPHVGAIRYAEKQTRYPFSRQGKQSRTSKPSDALPAATFFFTEIEFSIGTDVGIGVFLEGEDVLAGVAVKSVRASETDLPILLVRGLRATRCHRNTEPS
jgi:hypothetical protein